ncbi:calnexin isoform X2 [Contarinia nasturtii]|uniref:calnexin isoform X2 n=1 Tax=Contarinia nasturtii TaxID=265458 RepID=UPI0012D3A59C|nr:calnexin isoform X2 [Contarinia nasturtii]
MKRWRFDTLLLIAILSTYLVTISANDDHDDDGLSIESEKIENPKPAYESLESVIQYESPTIQPGKFHFAEHFDDVQTFDEKWIKSTAKKGEDDSDKYDGVWSIEAPEEPILRNDLGLVLKSKARHSAIASRLIKPFVFTDKPLIVQYEVQLQDGQECGGSYIKLLSSGKETTDLKTFHDKTPYTIMFGPDKCGNDYKLHFIFRHTNPLNGSIEEKHAKKTKERIEEVFTDKKPHLYQLIVRPDNTYSIAVDHKIINEGSLLTDFTPPVNPPKEIDDPKDFKPESWDEREKIPDPHAAKPEDWDEQEPPQIPDVTANKPTGWLDDEETMIHDPTAKKPEDWDSEIDGEWEAPLIPNPICEKAVGCGLWKAPLVANPKYRGKWRAPLIDNPNYQGKWAPRRIANPDFFEDFNPFKMTPISAVGLELWSMSNNILFDNLLITDDIVVADEWAAVTFDLKQKQMDLQSETMLQRLLKITDDKPWLWAVFVLAGGLPITLFIYFRCFNKDPPREKGVKAKKTDEIQPDDEEVEEEFEIEESETKNISRPASKLDLEEPITTSQNEEEDDENELETNDEPVPKDGARKRKPRKD